MTHTTRFFFFFLPYFFLHRLENRTKPISTIYDGRRWWDSNLRTPACKLPALPLCYGRWQLDCTHRCWKVEIPSTFIFFTIHIYFTSFRKQEKAEILTRCGGRRWWDSNLHTPTCELPFYHCVTDADTDSLYCCKQV